MVVGFAESSDVKGSGCSAGTGEGGKLRIRSDVVLRKTSERSCNGRPDGGEARRNPVATVPQDSAVDACQSNGQGLQSRRNDTERIQSVCDALIVTNREIA